MTEENNQKIKIKEPYCFQGWKQAWLDWNGGKMVNWQSEEYSHWPFYDEDETTE